MTAVSAAVLVTIAVPASAAARGAEVEICSSNRIGGSATISGTNQDGKKTTSRRISYIGSPGSCSRLADWWWLAPSVDINYTNSRDGQVRKLTCFFPESRYGQSVRCPINF